MDENNLGLGPCCHCQQTGPAVRNVIMFTQRAPIAATGWGCFQCGLPNDGAVAVLCDDCMEASKPILFACVGYPRDAQRIPLDQLKTEHFDHDYAKHPEEQPTLDDYLDLGDVVDAIIQDQEPNQ